MHPRDAEIISLARFLLGPRAGFEAVVGALEEAVTRTIPAGRVYVLGRTGHGPIVGSLVSGVGVTPCSGAVDLVRVESDGRVVRLGSLGEREVRMSVR